MELIGHRVRQYLLRRPTATFNVGANHSADVGDGNLDLNANYVYNSGRFASPDNTHEQPSCQLLNATVTWTHPEGRMQVRLWDSNLRNELYPRSMRGAIWRPEAAALLQRSGRRNN